MAESKGVMLAKSVQKHAGRAKEKILQNLGKVDRTADEIFDDHLNNFNRQQGNANRLQKEFNSYIRCIRAAQVASKSLMDAISEIYEPQWTGYDALQAQIAASESLWLDFAHKLGDQVLIPLNTYTGQFPEMKKKVEKRNRKLIDYDSQRHSFQSLQASANKRKDDVKLTKGREQLEEARRTYEILNTELHDELPALYDSRILFLVTNLQTLFATEQVFHSETSKIYSELEAIVDKLATDSQRGSNTFRKQAAVNAIKSGSPVQTPVKQMNNTNMNNYQNQITTNGSSNINSPTSSPSTSSQQQEVRLDPISPTPESSPEKLPSAATTAAATAVADVAAVGPTSMPASSTISSASTEASYQNVAAIITATETSSSATVTATATAPTVSVVTTTTTLATASPQRQPEELENNANARNKLSTIAKATTHADDDKITSIPVVALNPMRGDDDGHDNNKDNDNDNDVVAIVKNTKAASQLAPDQQLNGNGDINGDVNNVVVGKVGNGNINGNGNSNVEDNKKSLDASTTDLPPGVLYRVKATYGYVKEDADELSFEIGDIIRVIEYDDPEDQEEGWLMGQKEGTDEKGLFPANFTRPI